MSHTTLAKWYSTADADPAYTRYLGELRDAGTRADAARIVALLSSTATDIAAALIAAGPVGAEDEGTNRDPLVWEEVTTQLNRMALALSGGVVDADAYDFMDRENESEWEDLSKARTRIEFAAAWAAIKEELVKKTAADGEDKPQLREFAVTQVLAVAAAVMDARW
jgi:hypothetical protein